MNIYDRIAAAFGWTEGHGSDAEGIFFQHSECAVIETALENAEINANAAEQLTAATTANEVLQDQIGVLNTAAELATEKATTDQATIADLQGQIAILNGKSSGAGGSKLKASKDEETETTVQLTAGIYKLDDPMHPQNVAAANLPRKRNS